VEKGFSIDRLYQVNADLLATNYLAIAEMIHVGPVKIPAV
jgi:hypothetical protein